MVDTVLPVGGGPDGKCPIFVPAGTLVGYQVYVLQRRKDIFGEDADEFRPERWETLRPGYVHSTMWRYIQLICLIAGITFPSTEDQESASVSNLR